MVTLKGSYTVKPEGETPNGLMYLPDIDLFTFLSHSSILYFYRRPTPELTPNSIQNLKASLAKALAIFYPLAGRLQPTSRGRFEINCNSAGAVFVEAEIDAKIDGYDNLCLTPTIGALVASVDYERPIQEMPLLLVQLTKFSCGGVSLGVSMSHAVVDGQSMAHFVSEWARINRGERPMKLPFLDRTVLRPDEALKRPMFDHPEFGPAPALIGQSSRDEERKEETDVAILKLSKDQIRKLQMKANEYRTRGHVTRAFSRYEAVAAHVWRCVCKARQHKSEQLTRVRIVVDIRSRIEPPLHEGYFGNAILPVVPTTASGEIVSKPLGYTSEKLREAIDNMNNMHAWSSLVYLRNQSDLSHIQYINIVNTTQKRAFYGDPNLSITNWSRVPFYGIDFGWGKESNMVPGRVGDDEKIFILPGREEDGSLTIPMRLKTVYVDAFKKFFYRDIYDDILPSTL